MSVFLFFAGVYLLGLCWSCVARPRLGIGFCCAVAYPLGLVLWVLQSLVILCSPLPYGLGSAVAGWAILIAVGVLVNARSVRRGEAFSSRELAILGAAAWALVAERPATDEEGIDGASRAKLEQVLLDSEREKAEP